MAAFLYILQSETSGKFYVGSTDDLERRLSEDGRGHTPSTRGRGLWKLVHKEGFASLLEARRRELEIKRWKSSRMIRALVATPVG
jgi:putative endonuclease